MPGRFTQLLGVYGTLPVEPEDVYLTEFEKRRRARVNHQYAIDQNEDGKLMMCARRYAIGNHLGWVQPVTVEERKAAARPFLYSYNLESVPQLRHFGFLYSSYRAAMWWWEPFGLFVRVAFVACCALVRNMMHKVLAASLVLVIAAFMHIVLQPYKRHTTQVMAVAGLAELLVSLICVGSMWTNTRDNALFTPAELVSSETIARFFVWSNVGLLSLMVAIWLLEGWLDGRQAWKDATKKFAAIPERRTMAINTVDPQHPEQDDDSESTHEEEVESSSEEDVWNRKDVKWKRFRGLQMGYVRGEQPTLPDHLLRTGFTEAARVFVVDDSTRKQQLAAQRLKK